MVRHLHAGGAASSLRHLQSSREFDESYTSYSNSLIYSVDIYILALRSAQFMQRLVGSATARRTALRCFMSSSVAKKQKTTAMAASNAKTIGTHSGTFHCDEALGCFLLHQTKVRVCSRREQEGRRPQEKCIRCI